MAARDPAAGARIARDLVAAFPAEAALLHAAGSALLELSANEAAAAALAAAVAARPSAAGWNDYGVALQRSGDLERAIAAYTSALGEEPDFAEALVNLAAALYLTGRYREALPHARRATALRPETPDLAAALAMIEGVLFGYAHALDGLDAALARTPDDISARVAHVYTLRRLERFADALTAATELVERNPDAASYELLGTCLRDLGRYPEALAAFETAVTRAVNAATVFAASGEALLDLGDVAGARDRFARALDADPSCVAAWAGSVHVRTFATADPELARMEALLASPRLAVREERIVLEFALGKALLGAGEDARAFHHLAAANRLRRETIVYDVARDEARADAIVATVDATAVARLARGGFTGPAPIVVIGMPRSGTSLVEQILASLPNVHGAGELPFARNIIEADAPYPGCVERLSVTDVAALGARYAAALDALTPPGMRAVDKMPANHLYAGLLHCMLPDARIVLCTRDPLDTGLSLYTAHFSGRQDFAYDLVEVGRYYRAYHRIVAHWRAILPAQAFFELHYEALVTDFESTVRALLAFCELPWHDACRRFYATPRAVATASRAEVRQPLYRASIGRARRYAAYLQPLFAEVADLA